MPRPTGKPGGRLPVNLCPVCACARQIYGKNNVLSAVATHKQV